MIWFQFGSGISFVSQNANLAPTGPSLALDHLALNQMFKSERGFNTSAVASFCRFKYDIIRYCVNVYVYYMIILV